MANINIIRKLSGIPAEELITKEVVDELIVSPQIAEGRAQYILDRQGRKWFVLAATTQATVMLNRLDVIEFWLDGEREIGFFPSHPHGRKQISQGKSSMSWDMTILFLEGL